MRKATKYFNTSGPNIPTQHYTIERAALVEEGKKLVFNQRYFAIWAPRQSGKSTYFRRLCAALAEEGYIAVHFSVEGYYSFSEASLVRSFCRQLERMYAINWDLDTFESFQQKVESTNDIRLVMIIDEIESFNPEFFNQFLHIIRNLYHSREKHCLKSVILVGVANITGIIQDNASPFNIADTLEVDYFTREEVFELLGMHEADTDQLFSEEVKDKIHEITAGQPGLVNGFALKLVENNPEKDLIVYEDYLKIEKNYLSIYIDKNISNIINKARQHRAFVEKLLFQEVKIPFQINDEVIRELSVNGLIEADEEYNIIFSVPLYKKCLQIAFYPHLNGEAQHIQNNIWWEDYMTEAGLLDIDKIIREYQAYAQRRGFRAFFEKDEKGNAKGLKEAALMYSFETYIQAFLLGVEGKSYLEPHVALGRSDLIVNVRGQEFVIETKIYYDVVRFLKGKTQLAYYVKSLGLKIGVYLVFASNEVTHRKIQEAVDEIEGVTIYTYLVRYDLKKDFEIKELD